MCSRRGTRAAGWLAGLGGAVSAVVAVAADSGVLIDAVKTRDTSGLRALLVEQADVNEADSDGTSALHWAVHHGDVESAAMLLDAGAAPDAANRYGVRPLYLAAENGDVSVVQTLLEAGADPRTPNLEGETPLMTAARTGDVATIEALIAADADVNAAEDRRGQTALMWAAAENNGEAVTALIRAGADRDAVSAGGEFTALTFAVRSGAIASAKALLDAGANVDATLLDGTSLLGLATLNAHWELASVLLDYGANAGADGQGWTALHQVVWSRRWNRGFNLPGPVETGDLDSLELVRKLVAHGADVNARQKREPRDGNSNGLKRIGATPLLLAAKSADVALMRTLLDLGADPGLATDEGTTLVMVAAGYGSATPGSNPGTVEEALAALELALESGGGTVNDRNTRGETPLHGAVYRGGALRLIDFLVERGAKLDAVNDRGWMPVTVADGVANGTTIRRYPEAASALRAYMHEQGLPVPPVIAPGDGSGRPTG